MRHLCVNLDLDMSYERLDTARSGTIAFILVYCIFFLDNVLLTVLVPIIPDWVRGESLTLWSEQDAPLAKLLNDTVQRITDYNEGEGIGSSQLVVGAVLGAKSAVQLVSAPAAATFTLRHGPVNALKLATLLLSAASLVFAWCGSVCGGAACGVCAGGGRGAQGAGAALAGVAGLALVSRTVRDPRDQRAIAALLGAVALGVLVGYAFGGIAYQLWSSAAPFQIISVAFLLNLVLQCTFLKKDVNDEMEEDSLEYRSSVSEIVSQARGGRCAAGGGAVLLSTAVLAALEPCLPLWCISKFDTERWEMGTIFLPDSVGYLLVTSGFPLVGSPVCVEWVAVAGTVSVGLGALMLPHARSLVELGLWQSMIGGGVGAVDAALVPALLSRASDECCAVPHRAALLQAAASAALAAGPVVGGITSWMVGFESAVRLFGVANLLYSCFLYRQLRRYPLSEQWGASSVTDGNGTPPTELTQLGAAANRETH